LTFIDSEANFVDQQRTLVNFVKMRYISEIIARMGFFVSAPYCLQPVPAIQAFLTDLHHLPEPELFQASVMCESRGPHGHPGGLKKKKSLTWAKRKKEPSYTVRDPTLSALSLLFSFFAH
jgi:hypothetical protein